MISWGNVKTFLLGPSPPPPPVQSLEYDFRIFRTLEWEGCQIVGFIHETLNIPYVFNRKKEKKKVFVLACKIHQNCVMTEFPNVITLLKALLSQLYESTREAGLLYRKKQNLWNINQFLQNFSNLHFKIF